MLFHNNVVYIKVVLSCSKLREFKKVYKYFKFELSVHKMSCNVILAALQNVNSCYLLRFVIKSSVDRAFSLSIDVHG